MEAADALQEDVAGRDVRDEPIGADVQRLFRGLRGDSDYSPSRCAEGLLESGVKKSPVSRRKPPVMGSDHPSTTEKRSPLPLQIAHCAPCVVHEISKEEDNRAGCNRLVDLLQHGFFVVGIHDLDGHVSRSAGDG